MKNAPTLLEKMKYFGDYLWDKGPGGWGDMNKQMGLDMGMDPKWAEVTGDMASGVFVEGYVATTINGVRAFKNIMTGEIIAQSDAVGASGPGSTVKGTVKTGNYIANNAEKLADDIININKKYSNGNQMNNSISNIVNSASYYENPYDQVASITRSITQHAFENGNKRTAFDTLNKLLKDINLKSPLNDTQKWDLISKMGEGEIKNVTDISRILQGK
jgi:prophage maintenance system killer protein